MREALGWHSQHRRTKASAVNAAGVALSVLEQRRKGACWRWHHRCNLTVIVAADADLLLHIQQ